jgi:hypothetical protein
LALLRPPRARPTLACGGTLLNLLLLLLRDRGTGLHPLLMLTLVRTLLLLLDLRLPLHGLAGGLRLPVALRALDLVLLDGALGGRSLVTRRGGALR